uniref:Uncharacterized protein n=1 Tax=Dipterocladia arabiensis TaxID=2007176 RepID=A0A1Z1M0H7_9FLOR|nr:hypothetical protein [Dipterocladia arabiensis]ARW59371.1 hypothetical protein [Dipterocladia arabiensis]
MNLSYLSFYSQYLISPITRWHKINTNIKIFIAFILLMIVPYYFNIYKLYILIFLYNIFHLKTNINEYVYLLTIIYYIYYYNHLNQKKLLSSLYIYVPIKIKKLNLFVTKNMSQKLILTFNIYLIPKFIIKILTIYLIYIQTTKILLKSTQYESIVLFFLNILEKLNIFHNQYFCHFLFVVSLTSQFLQKIVNNLNIIIYSLQIKYNFYFESKIIYKLIHKYFLKNLYDSYHLSCILWSKEIFIENFYQ